MSKTSLNDALLGGYYLDHGLIQLANLELDKNENLNLHIFIDRSVLEVFVNQKLCLTHRIYPTLKNSKGVVIFSKGRKIKVPIVES